MSTEKPSAEAVKTFDDAVDDAVWAVLARFEWIGLPDEGSHQHVDLATKLNDAIAGVMREWL